MEIKKWKPLFQSKIFAIRLENVKADNLEKKYQK